jgi:flagellin-like hook-associated protein FlgL
MSDITLSKAVRTNLLSLQNTAEMMAKTQERLATGKKVNSALDNPTNFFTASSLNSRAGDLNSLMDSMANGIKTLEAADNGLTAITKTLESMQSTLRQARQDKSFQNSVYEVNANSVLTVDGGQFSLPTEIKLGVQTPGTKAKLETLLNDYRGPDASTAATEKGIGARALITNTGTGLVDGAVIKVAGMNVTLDDADTSGELEAGEIAAQIDSVINALSSPERNKYTVSVGAAGSPNEGKVIIESIEPTAPPATVEMISGSTAATKAFTKFNYNAITSSVSVGGEPVATGTSFEQFVANLKLGEKAGNYVVEEDLVTKDIKLVALTYDGAAPVVAGIPPQVDHDPGTASTTTFQVRNAAAGVADTTQTLSFGTAGALGSITIGAGMQKADIDALFADPSMDALTDAYTVNVATNLTVTLTAKTNDGVQGPLVTSSKGATVAVPSTTPTATGGFAFVTETATLMNAAGAADIANIEISLLDTEGGNPVTFNFGNNVADTVGARVSALQAAATAAGYTVAAADGGLTFSRADGKAFDITISGGATTSLGLGVTSTVNVTAGTEIGLVGGNAAAAAARTTGNAEIEAVSGQTSEPASADGIFVLTEEADTDSFKVTYDGKTADIGITGIKGGIGTTPPNAIDIKNWQDATIVRVNAQLKDAGITGVEAAFDNDGKFSIVAKNAEAKSIVISTQTGIDLFGSTAVDTGTPTVDGYSASTPVDKFVEEINRSYAGKLRASNDNGKLRIENLSTLEMNVAFDADGTGPGNPVASKIAGNSVRDSLADQFNDLKNQLDRLSDDASFNGINLLRGDNLKITFNENGSSFIDVQTAGGKGLNSSALKVENLQGIDLDTDGGIDKLLDGIKLALSSVRSQASAFGSNLSIVQNRQAFTKQMINTLETGAANLTLADMNEEAANLLALQTRQSLSSSSLSLASQADQSVLQLLQ